MPSSNAILQLLSAPRTAAETGVPEELIQELVYKMLHVSGELTGSELAERLGVVFSVIEPFLETMKRDRHCQISGGGVGPQSYVYRLGQAGHEAAATFAAHNQYVGKVPVPLSEYERYMANTASRRSIVTRESVREAYDHLVLSEQVLDQLGPAIAAGHSLFIYGPPGNGKTVISQAIGRLLTGGVAIPHAVSIDTEVIRVFDPINHEPLEEKGPRDEISMDDPLQDERWVQCKRPVVTVGGELTLESLELGISPNAGFYRAPVQTLANGGVLVIDDFGRQRIPPRDLLNRWIVPLESRVDYLTLRSGQKFEMPFDVLVVFATNLNPMELVDEAFLRRIRYKVYAESPTPAEFVRIFQRSCQEHDVPFERGMIEAFVQTELLDKNIPLRGCQPRDLIEHVLSLAAYTDAARRLTPRMLSAACATYFLVDDRQIAK